MEPGVIAVIILVALAGGTLIILSRQRTIPWSLPALRTSIGAPIGAGDEAIARDRSLGPGTEPNAHAGVSVLAAARPAFQTDVAEPEPEDRPRWPEPVRLDIAPSPAARLAERLETIEARLDELRDALDRRNGELTSALMAMQRLVEASEARRDAGLERLRADVMAALSQLEPERQDRGVDRRVEISAELYARLARFESALAAVTNPVLLPGEPYAAPAELLTEALIWENWNEVGERAFALADAYSAQRLYLSERARAEVGDFVTALRLLLTRSIYPNLHADLDAAQQSALRSALDEIAVELQKVRAALEREYREACEA